MEQINDILTRGVANVIPSSDALKKLLQSGQKLNIYLGIDPTAVNIHLGHAVTLRKLQKFAELEHNVTFLVGDFTALIGDTSDKDTERPQLTSDEIQKNLETYKEQVSKVLDFSKIQIKFNSEWLGELKFEDVVKLTKHFTLNDFISRELIKKRLNDGKSVGLLETFYPLMQGYDSYQLDTDIQIGGTDQTFNMQAGRTLIKNLRNKESYVLTMNFLTGTDGRKMSKTWGNAIWLTDSPDEMFGKVMSISDDLIIEYFTLATDTSDEEIKEIENKIKKGENPMDFKKQLAYKIVDEFHGVDKAKEAEESFASVVQHKEVPLNIQTYPFASGATVAGTAVSHGLVDSNSEWKRLVSQGAVTVDGHKIDNQFLKNDELPDNGILKIGSRTYGKIKKS